jgi:sigma-B regulation protein RsbU (phosphoserine phosphatase)
MPQPALNPASLASAADVDAARLDDLRRRVELYAIALGTLVLAMAALLWAVTTFAPNPAAPRPRAVALLGTVLLGVFIIFLPRLRRRAIRARSLNTLVWRVTFILVAVVVSQAAGGQILADTLNRAAAALGITIHIGPGWPLLPFILLAHTAASIILPWTPWEASRPILLILLIPLAEGLYSGQILARDRFYLSGLALMLAAGTPGVLIAWARQRRFAELVGLRLIGERYATVERELSTARRIHERLFPTPIANGPLRFDYRYQPMRQIGGDYLDALPLPDGSLALILIDVTGHGITAALAVNRLHGELRRTLAARSQPDPAHFLHALNEYIHLTLADEQVFATAAAVRLSPDGSVHYANAGHPPAFIRRASGRLDRLEPTAMMLGAAPAEVFSAEECADKLHPGDTLLLYTDGAIEARNAQGRQLGIEGLANALRAGDPINDPATACERLMAAVDTHRDGHPEDDTLAVAVTLA